jgi:hypothetical protein
MKIHKNVVKLANLLLDKLAELQYEKLRYIHGDFEGLSRRYIDMRKDTQLFYLAIGRRWYGSAENILTRTGRNINELFYSLQRFKELIERPISKLPRPADICAELEQLEQEMEGYHFDSAENTLSVITEPITLEGLALGEFEIKLTIDQIPMLYLGSPYAVIAIDANPAGADDNVTHPHVSGERLCEGDGKLPIRKALEEGRIYDFFTLINSTLQTYNPNSAYIRLEEWQGIACYDCGYTIAGDDCYYCEDCQRDFCESCSTCCPICDTIICAGCAYECPACGEAVCRYCTVKCPDCEGKVCKDCLTEEGICPICEEDRKEESDEEKSRQKDTADAAVQPDSVGQAKILS